jgi:hypothetical protein
MNAGSGRECIIGNGGNKKSSIQASSLLTGSDGEGGEVGSNGGGGRKWPMQEGRMEEMGPKRKSKEHTHGPWE